MEVRPFVAALALVVLCVFVPSLAQAQEALAEDEEQLLVRVELVLESRDSNLDRRSVLEAVMDAQRAARGRALTVLHVVVPVGGDAAVHVYELADDLATESESFVIPRGGEHWLRDALVEHVARRLVRVRAPTSSLLLSWDGDRIINPPAGLIEWHVLLVEDGGNLASPPPRT